MSQDTLNILNQQRAYQIELSPFSEEFTINDGPDSFCGIFDNFHIENNNDDGNVSQKRTYPAIMVAELPAALTNQERIATVKRENGDSFIFQFFGKDKEGVPIIWLA